MDFADQMALAARLALTASRTSARSSGSGSGRCCSTSSRTPRRPSSSCCGRCSSRRGSPSPVTAVGDPHQSIYGWRGASATTLSEFRRAFGDGAATGAGAAAGDQLAQRRGGPRRGQRRGRRRCARGSTVPVDAAGRPPRRGRRSGRGGPARDGRGRGGPGRRLAGASDGAAGREVGRGAVPQAVPVRRSSSTRSRRTGVPYEVVGPRRAAAHPRGRGHHRAAPRRARPEPRRPADAAAHRPAVPAGRGRPRRADGLGAAPAGPAARCRRPVGAAGRRRRGGRATTGRPGRRDGSTAAAAARGRRRCATRRPTAPTGSSIVEAVDDPPRAGLDQLGRQAGQRRRRWPGCAGCSRPSAGCARCRPCRWPTSSARPSAPSGLDIEVLARAGYTAGRGAGPPRRLRRRGRDVHGERRPAQPRRLPRLAGCGAQGGARARQGLHRGVAPTPCRS